MLRNPGRLSLALSLLALSSCEAVTGVAPEGTPRIEIELAVSFDAAFLETLPGVQANSDLLSAAKETVRDEADLGLRFYPTPSEAYGANDGRPPYLMTVELRDLALEYDHDKVDKEDGTTVLETHVSKILCSVSASIERRRANGPTLLVGANDGSAFAKGEGKSERIQESPGLTVRYHETDVKVLERDILRAVRRASKEALQGLRKPIDREFAPLESEE